MFVKELFRRFVESGLLILQLNRRYGSAKKCMFTRFFYGVFHYRNFRRGFTTCLFACCHLQRYRRRASSVNSELFKFRRSFARSANSSLLSPRGTTSFVISRSEAPPRALPFNDAHDQKVPHLEVIV